MVSDRYSKRTWSGGGEDLKTCGVDNSYMEKFNAKLQGQGKQGSFIGTGK
jgi:hypothetical protein